MKFGYFVKEKGLIYKLLFLVESKCSYESNDAFSILNELVHNQIYLIKLYLFLFQSFEIIFQY